MYDYASESVVNEEGRFWKDPANIARKVKKFVLIFILNQFYNGLIFQDPGGCSNSHDRPSCNSLWYGRMVQSEAWQT